MTAEKKKIAEFEADANKKIAAFQAGEGKKLKALQVAQKATRDTADKAIEEACEGQFICTKKIIGF